MKLLLIAVAAIALMISGFLYVGGVSPAIVVAPEHIFSIGSFAVTNTMFTSWWVVALLIVIAVITNRGLSIVPSGFSGAVEAAVEAFLGIVVTVAGEKNGRRFFPLVATIFFFVLISNYFGLLPLNSFGKPEAGHGAKQVVFQQSGRAVAIIPLKPQTIDVGGGQAPIVLGGGAPAEVAARVEVAPGFARMAASTSSSDITE
ncbi:MAG: F0F1 ATP synthase subunit A [Chloroflexota bacterium]